MEKAKRFLNNPKDIKREITSGFLHANKNRLHEICDGNIIVANNLSADKVGLLIGGGMGAEPHFMGYVGKNMADCAVVGNFYAAPSPKIILEATRAVDRKKGVLYLYNNYAGDNLSFDMAAELAEEEGIQTKTVRISDNIGSIPYEQKSDRGGIAGGVLVVKVAGGAASLKTNLNDLYRITKKANENTRSLITVAKSGTYLDSGELMFDLPEEKIEIGIGFQGEPGLLQTKMIPVNEIVDYMLKIIFADLPLSQNDEVILLLNNMGAITLLELLIINNRIHQQLNENKILIHDNLIGNYYSSQEMYGFSISLMKLDNELKKCYDMPVDSFAFLKGVV